MAAVRVFDPASHPRAERVWLLLNLLFVGMVALAGALALKSWRLVATGGIAPGRVVEVVEVYREGTLYYPVIEYEVDGVTYTFTGRTEAPATYAEGETVRMRYQPGDPARARIDSFMELWGLPAILVPYSLVSAAVTNAFFLYSRRRGRPITAG